MRWPDEVDVAGFGVFSQAGLYRPPLTLVAQPTHAMGEKAVELLVNRLQNGSGGLGDPASCCRTAW